MEIPLLCIQPQLNSQQTMDTVSWSCVWHLQKPQDAAHGYFIVELHAPCIPTMHFRFDMYREAV